MLNGRQKAQWLLSVLGEQSRQLLGLLSPESARLLTREIQDVGQPDTYECNQVLADVISRVDVNAPRQSLPIRDGHSSESRASSDVIGGMDELDLSGSGSGGSSIFSDDDVTDHSDASDDGSESAELQDAVSDDGDESLDSYEQDRLLAKALVKQGVQLTAFYLSRFPEEKRLELVSLFPTDFRHRFEERSVAQLPLSDSVYATLEQSIAQEVLRLKHEEAEAAAIPSVLDSNDYSEVGDTSSVPAQFDADSLFDETEADTTEATDVSSDSVNASESETVGLFGGSDMGIDLGDDFGFEPEAAVVTHSPMTDEPDTFAADSLQASGSEVSVSGDDDEDGLSGEVQADSSESVDRGFDDLDFGSLDSSSDSSSSKNGSDVFKSGLLFDDDFSDSDMKST